MSPDDERHGTYAGSIAHYQTKTPTCAPCRAAGAEYRRNRRARLYLLRANSLEVPAIGSIRRIQALAALGHRLEDIAKEMGGARSGPSWFIRNAPTTIHRRTADRIAVVYNRLCMTVPDYPLAGRARRVAANKGWLPPLAWNDIDDPDETPIDWQYVPTDRAQAIRDMTARGDNLTHVARALDINERALERWCRNHGLVDEYRALAGREGDWNSPGNYAHPGKNGSAA